MAKEILTQETIMNVLDQSYEKCLNGVPKVSPSIEKFADDYLKKYPTAEIAARKMINNQIKKCATAGFISGFGGIITLPVAIPANVCSVLYVQMRMIACCAYMAGYDLNSDQVQTFVYACLAGVSVSDIFKKQAGMFGMKFAKGAIEKIPGEVLVKINQAVGFRFITKFGEKGIINLGDAIPVVGAFVCGGLDYTQTSVIGNRAYKLFILGDMDAVDDDDAFDVKKAVKKAANGTKEGAKIAAKGTVKAVGLAGKGAIKVAKATGKGTQKAIGAAKNQIKKK